MFQILGNVFVSSLICTTAILGDKFVIIFDSEHLIKAVIDNGTHAIIGGLSWLVVCMHRKMSFSSSQAFNEIILCTILSSLIDIDHFICAKSFKLKDIHILKSRPFLHNSTLIGLILLLIIGLSLKSSHHTLVLYCWILFVAFFTHHTRDATRRGYWFYPFGSTPPINYWLYITIIILTPYFVTYALPIYRTIKYDKNIVNIGDIYTVV